MEQSKNFIIYGPGRTGSHWVETIVSGQVAPPGLTDPIYWRHADCSFFPNGWIYHTNSISQLLAIPQEMKDSVTLIVCDRSNHFDAAISYFVANRTDEWFIYTDKPVEPFQVDPAAFRGVLAGLRTTCRLINTQVAPLYNRMIRVDYNSLVSAAIPDKYVADLLGIDYTVPRRTRHSVRNKNTRNYKELILNWDQLVDIHQNYPVDQ